MSEQIDSAHLGTRLATLRNRKGISIRRLAVLAGVDKNTILRVERGAPAQPRTLDQIARALGTTVGRQSLRTSEPHANFNVSRGAWRRWEPDPLLLEDEDLEALQDQAHRWRLGDAGTHAGFNGFLDCELFGGRIVSSVIELFQLSTLRSFPGEELLYCLRGEIRLVVGTEETVLSPGDAATVWADVPHRAGPRHRLGENEPPILLLSVRVEIPHQSRPI